MKLNIVISLFFILSGNIISQNIREYLPRDTADYVIKLTYNHLFDEAINLTQQLKSENPSSLQWKYFHAIILYRKSILLGYKVSIGFLSEKENLGNTLDLAFSEFSEIASVGDKLIINNQRDTTALFYTGAAYGYIGIYYANKGENFKAISEGKKGLDYFDRLIELCPNWGDAYLSRGLYNFYTSNVPWYIKPILWVLGKSGSEADALKYFQLVINKGRFAKYEAMEIMAHLYIRQKKGDLAFAIIDKLIQEFPESKYYYYIIFGAKFGNEEMLAEGNKLLTKGINLPKSETLSDLEKIEIGTMYSFLAQYYFAAKEYNKVIMLWKELMGKRIVPGFDSWGYIMLGNAYLEIGNKTEARGCYNWVIKNSNSENHKTIAKEKLSKL
ncbi:MAG: hypothetical protein FD143_476 [Ignavibacteria bacterium]|nr:MAG: hypothetical protein FD143_476 [Ignavibacteria bacterium]KAF0161547.1 MAG: hypothetical protein FD188_664 [Ignavibacteria bacterium]